MNSSNLTMLTDFYELTMMNGYLNKNMKDHVAVFDLFFRSNAESSYCIACGLEQAVEYLLNLKFTSKDIAFLRKQNCFEENFLQYLETFKFSGDIFAVEEGTVVFPNEPLLTVKAPLCEAQLVESALLNIINFQTLIATKAARICNSASPANVVEFGLRRAQAPSAAVYGARAAIIGGCSGTSNVLAGRMFDIALKGTHAHSWIMAFDSELEAFRAYAKIYPKNCLLLVDTYDTLKSGVPNAITVFKELQAQGYKPTGIRLDSGDLAYLSKAARQMLDENGFEDAKIFASGDLDEYTIDLLNMQGSRIDIYGVGTKLITSHSNPSLSGVYKLAQIEKGGKVFYRMKVSDNSAKITNPAQKDVYRLFDKTTNKAIADLICVQGETINQESLTITHPTERWRTKEITNFFAQNLQKQIMKDGKLVYNLPSVEEIRQNAKKSLDGFWDEYKRNNKPHLYKVDLSDKLYKLKMELLATL